MASLPEVYVARHGETAWTLTGQHTGRTDIPLTARGEHNALGLCQRLRGVTFTRVLVSPRARARRMCELAGFGGQAKIDPDLQEWDDGQYEGRRTADIRQARPGFEAVARSVRDLLVPRWLKTDVTDAQANPKQVYDLSMEFLIGYSLTN